MQENMQMVAIYQRIKSRTEAPVGKLMVNEILEKLWTHLMVNFITKLTLVAGKDVILVVCNRLSKNNTFYSNTMSLRSLSLKYTHFPALELAL